jgi:hypothetical protein
MQSLIYARYTDANLADWTLTRLPIPLPGPNEVLVKVYATSLNYIDVSLFHAHADKCRCRRQVQRAVGMFKGLGEKRAFPSQIGYDVAGRITAIGTQVTGYKVGDAVWSCLSEHETGKCKPCEPLHFLRPCTSEPRHLQRVRRAANVNNRPEAQQHDVCGSGLPTSRRHHGPECIGSLSQVHRGQGRAGDQRA